MVDFIGNLCDPRSLGKVDVVYRIDRQLAQLRLSGREGDRETMACLGDAIIEIRMLRDIVNILREK